MIVMAGGSSGVYRENGHVIRHIVTRPVCMSMCTVSRV